MYTVYRYLDILGIRGEMVHKSWSSALPTQKDFAQLLL